MRTLPGELAAHIAGETTTLAYGLKITRVDAAVYGFTSALEDATISGVTYSARPGLSISDIAISSGLAVGNMEMTTLHDGSLFTELDIHNRVWSNAKFLIFRYNWDRGSDPYFSQVVSLLHMNGANGSTSFPDIVPARVWTPNGQSKIVSAQQKAGGGAAYFDGTGDWIDAPDHADFAMGSGDFTMEMWIRLDGWPSGYGMVCGQQAPALGAYSLMFDIDAGAPSNIRMYSLNAASGLIMCQSSSAPIQAINTWYHCAYTRQGSNFRAFINGALVASATSSAVLLDSTYKFSIGRGGEYTGYNFKGWIDEFRITKGTARYTAAFTPPTPPFYDATNVIYVIDPCLAGVIGEAQIRQKELVLELRDLRQHLQQAVGSVTSKTCRHRLGSISANAGGLCMKDVSGAPFTVSGTVSASPAPTQQVFTDSGRAEASDYFGEGVLIWLTGENAGVSAKIKSFAAGVFTLSSPMFGVVQSGDTYSATAGCRKRLAEDCVTKFDNVLNFGGEPHAPGLDKITASAGASV